MENKTTWVSERGDEDSDPGLQHGVQDVFKSMGTLFSYVVLKLGSICGSSAGLVVSVPHPRAVESDSGERTTVLVCLKVPLGSWAW